MTAYTTANPTPGVSWSWGVNSFQAVSGTRGAIGTLDDFGFLSTLSIDGYTYTMTYNDDGFVTAVGKAANGSLPRPYISVVYASNASTVLGYVLLETGQYVPIGNSVARMAPTAPSYRTSNFSNAPKMYLTQALSPCAQCKQAYDQAMDTNSNQAGRCTSAVTAVLVACEVLTGGTGSLACVAIYFIGIADCVATYKIAEADASKTYKNCLVNNNCNDKIVLRPKPHQKAKAIIAASVVK